MAKLWDLHPGSLKSLHRHYTITKGGVSEYHTAIATDPSKNNEMAVAVDYQRNNGGGKLGQILQS